MNGEFERDQKSAPNTRWKSGRFIGHIRGDSYGNDFPLGKDCWGLYNFGTVPLDSIKLKDSTGPDYIAGNVAP